MRILLLGGTGQLGTAIKKYLNQRYAQHQLLAPTSMQLNLTDNTLYSQIIALQPTVIINAAAYTLVDSAESKKYLADKINRNAVALLGAAAHKLNIPVIHYSTDYVFDGDKRTPYTEQDTTNPLNTYGITKYLGEQALLKESIKGVIFRISWLYSSIQSNFVKMIARQINQGNTVLVVNDQISIPNSARKIAEYSIQYAFNNLDNNIHLCHAANDGHTSFYNFAKVICTTVCKKDADKYVVPTTCYAWDHEHQTRATRPRYSVLDNGKLISNGVHTIHWLDDFTECSKLGELKY